MALSGDITYNLTAREIVTYALRKINIVAMHEDPSDEAASTTLTELNVMLKGWQRYEQIWRSTEGYVLLVADVAGYSLTPRPHRIIDVRYRDSTSNDTIMTPMTRDEYFTLPDKTLQGTPTQWWYDHQQSTDSIFTWPVLATIDGTTPERIHVTYQRRYDDVDSLDENVDIPQEYLDVVGHNLAARLADTYGRNDKHTLRIIARAEMLKRELLDDDRPDFVQFQPDYGWSRL